MRLAFLLAVGVSSIACNPAGGGTDASTGSSGGTAVSTSGPPPSGGSGSGSSSDASTSSGSGSSGESPFDAPPMCSSGVMWTKGEIEDPHMHPGRICLDCHMQAPQPFIKTRFQIAGTVYPSGHEPDDCYGLDGVAAGVEVEVTDAMNQVITMPVNEAGNFMHQAQPGSVVFPITALVRHGDLEWPMKTPQMTGDCNSCHTQDGIHNALGRIVAP